jgi:hypothetical protein
MPVKRLFEVGQREIKKNIYLSYLIKEILLLKKAIM